MELSEITALTEYYYKDSKSRFNQSRLLQRTEKIKTNDQPEIP